MNKHIVSEKDREIKFTMDPAWEETAIKRIKDFKSKRDSIKVENTLKKLAVTADKINKQWPSGGDLMPALIEAAKANA